MSDDHFSLLTVDYSAEDNVEGIDHGALLASLAEPVLVPRGAAAGGLWWWWPGPRSWRA